MARQSLWVLLAAVLMFCLCVSSSNVWQKDLPELSHASSRAKATCKDGIANGDETGVDCGGMQCAPCQASETCFDGEKNQDETEVDCGGRKCPACQPSPTCSDGLINQDETDVDCGGGCGACQAAATCNDGAQNGDESGVDCGGNSCPACQPAAPTCHDGTQNQDEEGIDCGGRCAACQPAATCTDGIQNQDETGVDCGGKCVACGGGKQGAADPSVECPSGWFGWGSSCFTLLQSNATWNESHQLCQSLHPDAHLPILSCQEESKFLWSLSAREVWLGMQDHDHDDEYHWLDGTPAVALPGVVLETAALLGKAAAGPCARVSNHSTWAHAPCHLSLPVACHVCRAGQCQCPACSDGVQGAGEEGVDCGGACQACGSCSDGKRNGMETRVDCGGPDCPPCPTCSDGEWNGDEKWIDCGGECGPCPTCSPSIDPAEQGPCVCSGEDVEAFGKCWRVQRTQLTYPEAQAECEQWGGTLASVRSADENRFVEEMLGTDSAWIGLRRAGWNVSFAWEDESLVDFMPKPKIWRGGDYFSWRGGRAWAGEDGFWDEGPHGGELCAGVVRLNETQAHRPPGEWAWTLFPCAAHRSRDLLCSKPSRRSPPLPPAAASCPMSGAHTQVYRGKCWLLAPNQYLDHRHAELACRTWGGTLASVASSAELGLVYALRDAVGAGEWAWVGLRSASALDMWRWSDGSPLTFTHWRHTGVHSPFRGPAAAAVSLQGHNFGWNQWPSEARLANLVCSKPAVGAGAVVAGQSGEWECRGQSRSHGKCWWLAEHPMGRNAAAAACYQWGGGLASILSRSEGVASGVGRISDGAGGATAWIGLRRRAEVTAVTAEWEWEGSGAGVSYAPRSWREAGAERGWGGLGCGAATSEGGNRSEVEWRAVACEGTTLSHTLCDQPDITEPCAEGGAGWCEAQLRGIGEEEARVVFAGCCGCCLYESKVTGRLSRVGACAGWCTSISMQGQAIAALDPSVFAGMDMVRHLDMSHNNLTEIEPAALAPLGNLSRLSLAHNRIHNLSGSEFSSLSRLRELSLHDNDISALSAEAFGPLPHLVSLELQGNNVQYVAPNAFRGLTALAYLDLSFNALTEIPPRALACVSSLQVLLLCHNRIVTWRNGTFAGVTALRHLALDGNEIESLERGMLAGLTDLDTLRLHRNNISLVRPGVLEGLRGVRSLELHRNRISHLPAGLLESLVTLRWFSLNHNPLTCQPILPTRRVLTDHYSLKYLPACLPLGCWRGLSEGVAVSSQNPNYRTVEDELRLEMHLRGVTLLLAFMRHDRRRALDASLQSQGLYAVDESGDRRWWCVGGARSFDIRFPSDKAGLQYHAEQHASNTPHTAPHASYTPPTGHSGVLFTADTTVTLVTSADTVPDVGGEGDGGGGWGMAVGAVTAVLVMAVGFGGALWLSSYKNRSGKKGEAHEGGVAMVRRLSRRYSHASSHVSEEPMLRSRLSSVEERADELASPAAIDMRGIKRRSTEHITAEFHPFPPGNNGGLLGNNGGDINNGDAEGSGWSQQRQANREREGAEEGRVTVGVRRHLEPL